MPQPIKPIHKMDEHAELFDAHYEGTSQGLSEMQLAFMGEDAPKREAGRKYEPHTVALLNTIYKSEDDLLNIATALASIRKPEEKIYRVPKSVSDYDLLGLKAQGFLQGNGRSVTFTSNGRVALRDTWLTSTNTFAETRTKSRYIHPANSESRVANTASAKTASVKKFTRVASGDTTE